MGLREDALAAAEAAKTARVDAARATLAEVLQGADVSGLTVAADQAGMMVFAGDDMHLTVRGNTVDLVRNDNGWTKIGTVTSLASLGLLLAGAG